MRDRSSRGEVRVLDHDGTHVGVMSWGEAQARADEVGLQLVRVADADPPVFRIADPGRLAYEAAKAARRAGGHRRQRTHEVKLRPQTALGDVETKLRQIRRFVDSGDCVQVVVMLRGRQVHRDGDADGVLALIRERLEGHASVEAPRRSGRDVRMMIRPKSRSGA